MGTLKVNNIQSVTDGSVLFPQGTLLSSGTASSPSLTFSNDSDTGFYRITDNTIGISTGGTLRTRVDNNGLELIDGNATIPSISFINDTDTGFYRISDNNIGIVASGTRVGQIGPGFGGFTGNIIQIRNFSSTYNHTITNSSNWTSHILSALGTDWEVTITPRYINSIILLIYSMNIEVQGGTNNWVGVRISRKIGSGSYSEIFVTTDRQFGFASGSVSGAYINSQWGYNYSDSPNTTSVVSYKFPCRVNSGTTANINGLVGGNTSTVLLMEIQQ